MPHAPDHVVKIWRDCERIARLSDRILKVGPLNLGIDSALAVIPIAGGLYTIGVGAWLVYMGWKAGASPATLAKMVAFVGVDAATAEVPLVGPAVDILFPGHVLAAKALRRDIEARYGPIESVRPERRSWAAFAERLRTRPATA